MSPSLPGKYFFMAFSMDSTLSRPVTLAKAPRIAVLVMGLPNVSRAIVVASTVATLKSPPILTSSGL